MASKQIARELGGISTEVVLQRYADRTLVLVTQVGKVGALIQASLPATTQLPDTVNDSEEPNASQLPQPPPAIQLQPLLGGAPSEHLQTLQNLYVSQIATLIWVKEDVFGVRRSVVVGLALKKAEVPAADDVGLSESERVTFLGVVQMVQELLEQR
ncbi:hypothetical protein CYLTODRAFT_418177 [Cylindrobasidium torrendii FP15055 ss-10]|uniref:Proteasome assembly chaperone 3 n=1 Tax=Cylindrobasidium torrendii FP15055 ss-10 TaxID=1314674 RepID=A0A0D7BNU3_9AGAR|nr:hypothetical protein CYLTODRAFT_418177 [Cylindrobasidium torrendii FP15055 ss-10]